jgi:hypothetical protein
MFLFRRLSIYLSIYPELDPDVLVLQNPTRMPPKLKVKSQGFVA